MHLSVDTPTAELLHCTIAVRLPRGSESSQLYLNGIHRKYVIHGQTLHQHTVLLPPCPRTMPTVLCYLVLKFQGISALPSFSSSVHGRSHKSSSVVSLRLTYCSQSSWSWTSDLQARTFLPMSFLSEGPFPTQDHKAQTSLSFVQPSAPHSSHQKHPIVTIVDRIRPT